MFFTGRTGMRSDTEVTEKKEILKRYRHLLRIWVPKVPEDRQRVRKAFKLALEAHRDMRRKSGEPYIYHPLSVATIAAEEIGLGATSIIGALLHDVVEDTEYTLEDISGLFGEKVASIIDGLTKIKGIFDQRTTSIHAENFKRLLLTLSDDVRVILIKLADRLHNMRTLEALPRDKQLKISSETMYLYAPLAHRLGLYGIKNQLEDLALKYTEPEVYYTISRKMKESAKERARFVRKFIQPIEAEMKEKGYHFTIKAREKSISAIWHKMKKKEISFEEVYDIFAIRIVLDSPMDSEKTDCWKVYSLVTGHYKPNMDRLRDWISIPKANGYESLHTTVMSSAGKWVEIQIRSKRMDEIAEKGYAAHWKYKESMKASSQLDHWLDRIKAMIESPDANALSFIDDVKGYFFLDEISIFTPQGELRKLPANSTVLDFAYAIHSEIGNTCIGAKVDKKLVPINFRLRNGQQVEIITSRKQSPKEEWLNYVVTTRARSNIKEIIREEKKKFYRSGKEKLEEWFEKMDIEFSNEHIKAFCSATGYPTLIDLYDAAAHDKIGNKDVKLFRVSSNLNGKIPIIQKSSSQAKTSEIFNPDHDVKYLVHSENDGQNNKEEVVQLGYEFSTCCNPIPGVEVIGMVLSGQLPVQIHRINCPKSLELISTNNYKTIKLNWNNAGSISFLQIIKISSIERPGIINKIVHDISGEMNVNIKSLNFSSNHGLTKGEIKLFVKDTHTLHDLIRKIKSIDGVTQVKRMD
jgi:GTP pyrophosphokinase